MTSKSAAMRLAFMEMLLNAKDGQVFVMIKDGQPRRITVSHDCKPSREIDAIWIDEMYNKNNYREIFKNIPIADELPKDFKYTIKVVENER